MFKLRWISLIMMALLLLTACPSATLDSPPAVPAGLTATAGDGQVVLTWTANTESDLKGYNLHWGISSGSLNQTSFVDKSTTTYTVTNLTNETLCYFTLDAVDSAEKTSNQTVEVSATPTAKSDTTAPAIPTGFTATAGDGQVVLTWIANTEADLKGYKLYSGSSSGALTEAGTVKQPATTFTVKNLTNGTPYYFALSAEDNSGNVSNKSAEISATPQAPGNPGSLDTSFAKDGKFIFDLGGNDFAEALVVQPDGKLLAAGFGNGDFGLLRLNADGSKDSGFGTEGKVITEFGDYAKAEALALQSDGKILVAGVTRLAKEYDFALVRYTSSGKLDTTFGNAGKLSTDLGGRDEAYAIAVQADGKIVVAGYTTSTAADFALARYLSDGTLDSSFAKGGKLIIDLGGNEGIWALALQSDRKIVVAGFGAVLARFNADGSLDTGFGTKGKVILNAGFGVRALALQSDGKILLAGGQDISDFDFVMQRYSADGSLDSSFGEAGTVLTDFGKEDDAYAMMLQADGKIVLVGRSYEAKTDHSDVALARYQNNGSLDTSFGDKGTLTTDFGGFDTANAMVLQADGKIVVAGAAGSYPQDFGLARYHP